MIRSAILLTGSVLRLGTAALADDVADGFATSLQDWAALDAACRGGRGEDPRTLDACAQREIVDGQFMAEGWCDGRSGDAGYRRVWRRCAEDPRGRP